MKLSLRGTYPRVRNDGRLTYGGSQMLAESKLIRGCGCGPVAALDLLHYLCDGDDAPPLPLDHYNKELESLCRSYFPLIPQSGINGLMLALGVNRLFLRRHLPCRAVWAVSGSRLWERVREMLVNDLPVILSIGPNFPAVWKKDRLPFYSRRDDGSYVRSSSAKSHYVTVTGLDDEWARISSWGREYYIRRSEYDDFVKRHSSQVFSNILYIKRTDH